MKIIYSKKNKSDQSEASLSKGQASRDTILRTAATLATTRGLDGLSIGDLAAAVGMSKSGLYAHFKSKEELELATIEAAAAIFDREVVQPAMKAAAGIERLKALVDSFLSYLERRIFPGGCFFAAVAMELDTRPGLTRDRVNEVLNSWRASLKQCLLDAQTLGELDPKADVDQAVFEVQAMLFAGNFLFVMTNDFIRLMQSRRGVESVLARSVVRTKPKKRRFNRNKVGRKS
jgi:AcrR family transcriptional regulator